MESRVPNRAASPVAAVGQGPAGGEGPAGDRPRSLDAFTAELTGAAYTTALRHGIVGPWLDLELELWEALAETAKKWLREVHTTAGEGETLRDGRS